MADLKTKLRCVLASPYMVDLAQEALARIEQLERQAEGLCDGCGKHLDDAYCTACLNAHGEVGTGKVERR